MLAIRNLRARQAKGYYKPEEHLGFKSKHGQTFFFGSHLKNLGISEKFNQEQFESLLNGKTLDGRKINLKKEAIKSREKEYQYRAGYDLVFSAPKSISIMGLVFDDQRFIDAHTKAVQETIPYIEKFIGCQIKKRIIEESGPTKDKDGKSIKRKELVLDCRTNGGLGAHFLHFTSRTSDPQLHSHLVLFNGTYCENTRDWRAIDNKLLYSNSKILGSIYQNFLAQNILELGYDIEKNRNGTFEMSCFDKEQLREFSTRRKEIEKIVNENVGVSEKSKNRKTNNKIMQNVALFSRKKKEETSITYLKELWKEKKKAVNLGHIPKPDLAKKESLSKNNIDINLIHKGLESKKAFWEKKELFSEVLAKNLGEVRPESIKSFIESVAEVELPNTQDGVTKTAYTLKSIIHQEKCLDQLVTELSEKKNYIFTKEEISLCVDFEGLSLEQKKCLSSAMLSGGKIFGWVGVAGSGKSYALKRAAEAFKSLKNFDVSIMGADAVTVSELEKATGLLGQGMTIDKFLIKEKINNQGIKEDENGTTNSKKESKYDYFYPSPNDSKKEEKPTLYVIDEASKISTEKMLNLISSIKEKHTKTSYKIILTGDYRQLGAVERGSPFVRLIRERKIEHEEQIQHRRQASSKNLQAFLAQISDILKNRTLGEVGSRIEVNKEVESSFSLIESSIVEKKSAKGIISTATKSFIEAKKNGLDVLLLTGTHLNRKKITENIRKKMKKEGLLGVKEETLKIFATKNLDLIAKSYLSSYTTGDVIIFDQTYNDFKRGDVYTVYRREGDYLFLVGEDGSKKRINLSNKDDLSFNVYQKEDLKISKGDILSWTKNSKEEGMPPKINKKSFIIESVENGKAKILYDGKQEFLDLDSRFFADYAFVRTVYSSQGMTSDKTILAITENCSLESFYVACSRPRKSLEILTTNRKTLAKTVSGIGIKVNTMDNEFIEQKYGFKKEEGNKNIQTEMSL